MLGSRRCSGGREGSVSGLRRLPAPGARELDKIGDDECDARRRRTGEGRPEGTLEGRRLEDEEPAQAVVPLFQRPRGDDLRNGLSTV